MNKIEMRKLALSLSIDSDEKGQIVYISDVPGDIMMIVSPHLPVTNKTLVFSGRKILRSTIWRAAVKKAFS